MIWSSKKINFIKMMMFIKKNYKFKFQFIKYNFIIPFSEKKIKSIN